MAVKREKPNAAVRRNDDRVAGAPSSSGGAANERGSNFRSAVAAWAIAHGLKGDPIQALELPPSSATPTAVFLETANPVDDISIRLNGGGTAFVQAKRTLALSHTASSEFGKVVSQFKRMIRETRLDASRDRLVIAVEDQTRGLKDLGLALSRTRGGSASLSQRQQSALASFREAICDLSSDDQDAMTRATVVLQLDLTAAGARDSQFGGLLLDGRVVISGEGSRAFGVLQSHAWSLAQWRQGGMMDIWLGALREQGLTLLSDASCSAAAAREQELAAEQRYRQQRIHVGASMDLRSIGVSGPVPVERNIRVTRLTGERTDECALVPAIRRRGRVLLTGLPGGGKSTALRVAVAEWAGLEDWPLPVLANLGLLVDSRGTSDPLLAIINSLTTSIGDAGPIHNAIVRRATDGTLAIFLDGLDEAREKRLEMVHFVERLLVQVHADTEVIVATRDSAYSEAATLKFSELRVLPPNNALDIAGSVVRTMAESLRIDARTQNEWISERYRWVRDVLSRDRLLSETPLLPTLLATLACQSNDGALPTNRAEVLERTVDAAARRWEFAARRHGDVELASLKPNESIEALLESFDAVSARLMKTPDLTVHDVREELSALFAERWGLPPARASTAAMEAVHFWDEAGILVLGPGGSLSARLTVFAEIGAARLLSNLDPEAQRSAIEEAIDDPTLRNMLGIAAGLSSTAADTIINQLSQSDSLADHVAAGRMLSDGARADVATARRLRERLVIDMERGADVAWEIAKQLTRLPTPVEDRRPILAALEVSLTGARKDLALALALGRWGDTSASAVDVFSRALVAGRLPKVTPASREYLRGLGFVGDSYLVDSAMNAVVLLAARSLLKNNPQLAPVIGSALRNCSIGIAGEVEALLLANGHSDVVAAVRREQNIDWTHFARSMEIGKSAETELLGLISAIGHEAPLDPGESRRLDHLADFLATLSIGTMPAGDFPLLVELLAADDSILLRALADLAGFNKDLLASEVKSLDRDRHATTSFLFDTPTVRQFTQWAQIADVHHVVSALLDMMRRSDSGAVLAANALQRVPRPDSVSVDIDRAMDSFPPRRRFIAAVLSLILDGTRSRREIFSRSADFARRRASARYESFRLAHGENDGIRILICLLADRDAGVKEEVLSQLDANQPPDIMRRIRAVAADETVEWHCMSCGLSNSGLGGGSISACQRCKTTGPRPVGRAREILAGGCGITQEIRSPLISDDDW